MHILNSFMKNGLVSNVICLGFYSYRLKVGMLFLIVCLFKRPHFVEFSCLLRQFPFVISNLYNLDQQNRINSQEYGLRFFYSLQLIVKIISGNLPNIIWKNFLLSFSRAYPSMFSLSAKIGIEKTLWYYTSQKLI